MEPTPNPTPEALAPPAAQEDLLLHSLVNFRGFIRPLLDALEPSSMCEIGIEGGMATEFLLGYCRERVCRYVGIDPSAPDEARRRIEEAGQRFDARPSLEALRALPPCDVYFLDGDHNYYTVSNELRLILEAAETARRRPCVFIHDIGWPWGRRDLYYDPSRIPPEERHPYDYELGVRLGNPGLAPGGFRGLGRYACATREGGPRNGVLTAVEDVMKERPSLLRLISVPAVFGLGVLYAPESLDSRQRAVFDAFDETLESSGDLLRNLEHNRLSLYLRVLYLQDEVAPAMKSHIDAREAALRQLESARASLQKRGEELEAELQRLAQEIQSTQEEIARDQAQIAADAVRMQILRLEIWRQAAAGAQTAAELRAVKTSEAYRATWPLRFALDQLRRARAAAARSIREGRARCAKAGVAVIQNLAALLDVAAPYDIISLDIFDTLLRRDIEPPDSLKLRTAKYASMILGQRGFPVDYVLFQSVRDAAERELRVEAANRGRDFECGFEDIMRRTLERLVGAKVAAEESARLMDYELEIEARRLHVAPDAPSVLRELKRRGKRIVAVSDMYLQESHVRRLLGALGIGEWFDAIYMSSDHGAGKHSGRLFQTMLKAEGAAPAKVLHVGDNPVSDGVRPREAGLGAAWLRDPREMRRRGELHRLA
ncbi:MAG: HAD-IA family hydrolase, partial [Candidatus Sumerlaeota bacterium]|nr:HAD-IA family hydrolase [Candidatus Sumerlaeota bacterium]